MIGKFSVVNSILASGSTPIEGAQEYRSYARRQLAYDTLMRLEEKQLSSLGLSREVILRAKSLCR